MRRTLIVWGLLVGGCAAPREAKVVSAVEAETGVVRRITVDPLRLTGGKPGHREALARLVEGHLATVGRLEPARVTGEATVQQAELPTPGYALRARIEPHPEDMAVVVIEAIGVGEVAGKPVEVAPWWVHHAFRRVTEGVEALEPARQGPLEAARFDKLRAEAARLKAAGQDPPLQAAEFIRAPRRLHADEPDQYYAPPQGPSVLMPAR